MIPVSFQVIFKNFYLLKEFTFREIRGRFAGSLGGILWAFINPLLSLIIYFYIFSIVLRIPITRQETGTNSFFIFFLTGFFPWIVFAECLNKSVGILVENSNLITKVVFPVELLPTAVNFSSFSIHLIGMLLLLIFLFFENYGHLIWFFLPCVLFFQFLFVLGLSFIFSALGVFVRDIREIIGIVLMMWFYITPIIYPVSMVPENYHTIVKLNPMYLFINLYRDILLLHRIDLDQLIVSLFTGGATYLIGSWFFTRSKPAFGDVL